MYKNIREVEDSARIEGLANQVVIGYGTIDLMDEEIKKVLEVDGPYLKTRVYNTREASVEQVKKLWANMGNGETLKWLSREHAVIVGVEGMNVFMAEWKRDWNQPVMWSEDGKKLPMVLINGNHRLELVKRFLLGKRLEEFRNCVMGGDLKKGKLLRAELLFKLKWSARLIDMGKYPPCLQVPWNLQTDTDPHQISNSSSKKDQGSKGQGASNGISVQKQCSAPKG